VLVKTCKKVVAILCKTIKTIKIHASDEMQAQAQAQAQPQQTTERTKVCSQCRSNFTRDQFSNRQWKAQSNYRSCRLCSEYTKISEDKSRKCRDCKLNLPRTDYAIYQWSKGDEARCFSCAQKLGQKVLSSISNLGHTDTIDSTKERPDGTVVCGPHSQECCDICMMDFTLPNDFQRKKNELGRDLTPEEYDQVTKKSMAMAGVRINKKICIMDGQPMCPRNSKKLRCPCNEVTYCSTACQKYHWTIHKMTCKFHSKKKEKELEKKLKKQAKAAAAAQAQLKSAADDLTEEQKNFARKEAFFAENNGGKHSIEECAWQLGEHPFVIGGGSIRYNTNTVPMSEEFVKGDVAKIYREKLGVEWDGSPRFGMGPYEQKKTPEDWIAKARKGKSKRMKNLESELMAHLNSINM